LDGQLDGAPQKLRVGWRGSSQLAHNLLQRRK
jgi:hypothetical protein